MGRIFYLLQMKYLIVGLGNIGPEYEQTRHNIGFMVADFIAEKKNSEFTNNRLANIALYREKGRETYILKPTTYMNLSGKSVNYWLNSLKIPIDQMLIITDDLALPFGTIRLKSIGSGGGHNGLGNIEETLNSREYPRLRFGIGSDFAKGKQVDYVLSRFSDAEQLLLEEKIEQAANAVHSFIFEGLDKTMNRFN